MNYLSLVLWMVGNAQCEDTVYLFIRLFFRVLMYFEAVVIVLIFINLVVSLGQITRTQLSHL